MLIAVQGCLNKPVHDGCLGLCRELNAGDILAARVVEFSALAVVPMVAPTLIRPNITAPITADYISAIFGPDAQPRAPMRWPPLRG